MRKYVLICSVMLLLTLTLAVSAVDFDNTTLKGLNITSDVDGALSEAQSQNKSVALIFDQDSCVYCDMFKDKVLSNPDVQKELDEKYIVVMVDINKNPKVAAQYKVYGTPTTQFLDSKGNEMTKIEDMLKVMNF